MPYSWEVNLKRKQEILGMAHMAIPHVYEVYLTDEDLSFVELQHRGHSRDVAETILHGVWEGAHRKSDYMLFDVTEHRPLLVLIGHESKWGAL